MPDQKIASTIDCVRVQTGNIPVKVQFSYGAPAEFPFIIVRLTAGGCEGVGECLLDADKNLWPLAEQLVGKDARCLDALLPQWQSEPQRRFCEAMSMALYDLVGKLSGLPMWALLGGKKRDRIPLMPCIFPTSPEEAAELAGKYAAQGVKYLKTKLVGDLAQDEARIKAIRSEMPDSITVQGDANDGYKTLAAATEAVLRLGDAGLDRFEDPLDGGVEEYRQLRQACSGRAKVTVDRLARSLDDLAAVLKAEAADVVSLHPCQMGSMTSVLTHVRLAEAYEIPVVLAGTGYTAVGTAAWQQLTAAASACSPSGELGGAVDHGMPESLICKPLTESVSSVTIPDAPGLGVELDEAALARYRQHSFERKL